MSRPVFILARTPGADHLKHQQIKVVEWTDICHGQLGKEFILIDHQPSRCPSRWTHAKNKRPFVVASRGRYRLSASSTLEGAVKIAIREAEGA